MLTLFHNNQEIVLDTTEYYVRELASGLDEVIFNTSIWDPNYALLSEEANIVDRGGQRYLVKQIDAGAVTAKVVCQLDLDEWKASMSVGYNSGSKTVLQQIQAVAPQNWTVNDFSYVSISRTIEGDYTPLQVCEVCRDIYSVYIRWDNKTKICSIYPQAMGTPVGAFATRELNLKEINYKGKSQNFATRLYAYGKDGLSFASINNNKPYVDNNTYSSRVICAYWQDDRYIDKSSLLADAIEKLSKLAVPERSYDCAIVDLQATNPDVYGNLDFSLFTTATLIDDIKGTAVDYMVVERHIWPYHPEQNDVIFNSTPLKIQDSVVQIADSLTNPNSNFQRILQAEINMATDWLTNSNSHVYIVEDNSGGIKEFLFVNGDEPIETATQVMRLNASGLGFSKTGVNGPYINAFVFDSTLGGHLVADFITAGTMNADRIRGGLLQSNDSLSNPSFSLNMTTGELISNNISIETPNFSLINGAIESVYDSGSLRAQLTIDNGEITAINEALLGFNLSYEGLKNVDNDVIAPVTQEVLFNQSGNMMRIYSHGSRHQTSGGYVARDSYLDIQSEYIEIHSITPPAGDGGQYGYIKIGSELDSYNIPYIYNAYIKSATLEYPKITFSGQNAYSGSFADGAGHLISVQNGIIVSVT